MAIELAVEKESFLWEEELVQLFSDTIWQGHFSRDMEDVWVWKADNSKVYSVKSAYSLLLSHHLFPSDFSGLSPLFRNFWVSYAPRKVLTFSWQLILDHVPTRSNLLQRKVIVDSQLAVCLSRGWVRVNKTPFYPLLFFSFGLGLYVSPVGCSSDEGLGFIFPISFS